MILPAPPPAWSHLPFFGDAYQQVLARLEAETRQVLPASDRVFAALEATKPSTTRVIILGQDPYPTPGHAHGLAFSVTPETRPLPRSLRNIFNELQDDLGMSPTSGNLQFWADQGVLLLNTALTVVAGSAGAHAKLGWEKLTEDILAELSDQPRAFWLWGRHAQGFENAISGSQHLILRSPHPSPLSARRGFFGSRPFSRTNTWLKNLGHTSINWTLP